MTASLALLLIALGAVSCQEPADERRSVVLVVVDTLRADHLGTYGYERATSPNLDRWAARGRVYERAHSTSPWTLPTFGGLYTGLLPNRHGAGFSANQGNRLTASVPTLAEMFAGSGFETGAVTNNPFLHLSFGVDRGFATYDHHQGSNGEIRRAGVVVDRALEIVDGWDGRPFFLVVHAFDPHLDYDPPEQVRGVFTSGMSSRLALPIHDLGLLKHRSHELDDNDRDFVRAAYDEEIFYVDTQLARLEAGLAARGLTDSTLVVLTADHGEELFEHGSFEHGHAMWQELLRVPLIVWGPGVSPGRETGAVSLVDVAPTILEWSGVEIPSDLDGQSLLNNLETGAALPERALIAEAPLYGAERTAVTAWPLKAIVNRRGGLLHLFDLDADPLEQRNIRRAPGMHGPGRQLVAAYHAHVARSNDAEEAMTPDAETMERLRSLGYVR